MPPTGKCTCNNAVSRRKLLDVSCTMPKCMRQWNNAQKLQYKVLKVDGNACAHGIKFMADLSTNEKTRAFAEILNLHNDIATNGTHTYKIQLFCDLLPNVDLGLPYNFLL